MTAATAAVQPKPYKFANLSGKKLMLVDDSKTIRDYLRLTLTPFQLTMVDAQNGEEALELLLKTNDFNMIFCDINMPLMNGLVFAQRVFELVQEKKVKPVPIIMVTTEGSLEKVKVAKQYGVLGWVIKPPKPEHLFAIVEKFIKK